MKPSYPSKSVLRRTLESGPLSLFKRAGRSASSDKRQMFESLENRVLLGGDHPSFSLPPSAILPAPLTINVAPGFGSATGVIGTAGDDDVFKFTTTNADFVTVRADTLNVTGGSALDSRVEVYLGDGTLVTSGNNSDTLTGGFLNEGWAGFVSQANTTYYVRVMSNAMSGATATGGYIVRVDTTSEQIALNTTANTTVFGFGQSGNKSITTRGQDTVYRVTTTGDQRFDSLVTLVGRADPVDFDSRIDVYNAQGVRIDFDSQAGRATNAFAAFKGAPNSTYYIRLRSDEFAASSATALGNYNLQVDFSARDIEIDPVVRRGVGTDALADGFDTRMFEFQSQGTGFHIITVVGLPIPPLADPAIHIYDADGNELDFNKLGGAAEIQLQLNGGSQYFVVIETFDNANGGSFGVWVEANHTINTATPVDDHANTPGGLGQTPPPFGSAQYDALRQGFSNATPLIPSAPQVMFDQYGNTVGDIEFFANYTQWGRIHGATDTDLFSFVAPIDQLSDYGGDDGNEDAALYVGGAGNFSTAGVSAGPVYGPRTKPNIAIWDAGNNFWAFGADFNGQVRAMQAWDFDGNAQTPLGMVAAGQFTQIGAANFGRIAMWTFDALSQQYFWANIGTFNGQINAVTTFDLDFDPGTPDNLIVGGSFTTVDGAPASNIAVGTFDPILGAITWAPLFTGTSGPVNAFGVYLPGENAPTTGPMLAIGGEFDSAFGVNAFIKNLTFVYEDPDPMNAGNLLFMDPLLYFPTPYTAPLMPNPGIRDLSINGPVYALQGFDPEDPAGGDPAHPVLVIGGEFTQVAGNMPRQNLATLRFEEMMNMSTMPAQDQQTAIWGTIGNAGAGVFTLALWDRDGEGQGVEELVAGGRFTSVGGAPANHIASFIWDGMAYAWAELGGGTGDTVRALHSFVDEEAGVDGQPILYAGGDFLTAGGVNASRIAKFEFNPLLGDWEWKQMGGGSTNTVLALASMNDEIDGQWDRNDRAATRVQMVLSPTTESFADMFVRVYDSNFNLIYTNDTISPPFPDPAGMIDPSMSGSGDLGALEGIQVWGGETYYVEVSSVGSTGRYTLNVKTAVAPPDVGNGHVGHLATFFDTPDAGDFANAPEIGLATTGSGDGRNYTANPLSAYQTTSLYQYPSGSDISFVHELGGIESIDDTDLFRFRATGNGTVEIRLNTTQLQDEFTEIVNGTPSVKSKTYNSYLDGYIKVYNNDRELIAFVDNTAEVLGELAGYSTGDFGRVYFHRDPRVVINAEAGEIYYVEVGSAQLEAFNTNVSEVDWRSAFGSYELLINAMPNLAAQGNPSTGIPDDHFNTLDAQATTIAITAATGNGSLTGVIDSHVFNPLDVDIFQFLTPAKGEVTVTLTNGALLSSTAQLIDNNGFVLAQGSAAPNGSIVMKAAAQQGSLFFIAVAGGTNSNGGYTVTVDGAGYSDDHASVGDWHLATELEILDFLGQASASGNIEHAGDTDVFYFETFDFDLVTVNVTAVSSGFDPFVTVYEISEDPSGNPILQRVAFNDNANGSTLNSSTFFPVTAADRTSLATGNTYNRYYVMVQGAIPGIHSGQYQVQLTLAATDDHADEGQFEFASPIVVNASSGDGDSSGLLEISADSDLFQYTAPAGGPSVITITSGAESALRPSVRIFDSNFNPIADLVTGLFVKQGADATVSTATFSHNVTRNAVYYILVDGVSGGTATVDTGAFSVDLTTPTVDDHANITEFDLATQIGLAVANGDGLATGVIEVSQDSDIFFFRTLEVGTHKITLSTPNSDVTPLLRIYDQSQNLIFTVMDGGLGDEDGTVNGTVVKTVNAVGKDQRFNVLVSADPTSFFMTGGYTVAIDGTAPIVPPPTLDDDHADAGQFNIATPIGLSAITGDGTGTGSIEFAGDTDLFVFSALRAGRVFIHVLTQNGSLLDAGVKIFNQSQQLILSNTEGIPGVNAYAEFQSGGPNQLYYIEVDGLGSGTGAYSIKIDAAPEVFRLYFPEGFATGTVREFVSVTNPNATSVTYSVVLRYENPSIAPITIHTQTLAAGKRGGVTISDGPNGVLSGVTPDAPYAIVIESTGEVGATLAHFDFGLSLGETFTTRTSNLWTFAGVTRAPGQTNDFLLFYNPNPSAVRVTFTAYTSIGTVTFSQTIEANRRGGININDTTQLPIETFGVAVTSQLVTPGGEDLGIVASLSHYDVTSASGVAVLGDPNGGTTEGVITSITRSLSQTPSVQIFNPGNTVTAVTFTGSYILSNLPDVVRIFQVPARSTLTLGSAALGLIADQPIGFRYESSSPVTVAYQEVIATDANGTAAGTAGAVSWFFGDAFINVDLAGTIYLETLSFYNPDDAALPVSVKLYFSDGTSAETIVNVGGDDFAILELHKLPAILDRGGLNFFGIEVTAAKPFLVDMVHYDLFLGGGFGTSGSPLGPLVPLTSIN